MVLRGQGRADRRPVGDRRPERKEEFSLDPCRSRRCGPARTTRSHAWPTWTGPASSRRCASRRSPASAARSSGRPRTRTSALALRPGLQRLDDRRVVRRRAGPVHPAHHHPAVGSGRPRRRSSAARRRAPRAFCFSENPEPLGLPTIHDPNRYWDPVMAAAQDTQMVVCMHVGSSSTMPVISSDAPGARQPHLRRGARAAGTMLAWLFSDYFERMPGLKIALSEGNIGWMPYFIERAEQVIDKQRHWAARAQHRSSTGTSMARQTRRWSQADLDVARRPRHDPRAHLRVLHRGDGSASRSLDIIGEDNVMVETDYPHSDTTWPDSHRGREQAWSRTSRRDAVQDPARQRRAALPLHAHRAGRRRGGRVSGGPRPAGVVRRRRAPGPRERWLPARGEVT